MIRNKGIAFRLKLYILTGIAVIGAGILILDYYSARKLLISNVKQNADNLARATVNHISIYLASAEKIPLNLALILEGSIENEEQIKSFLKPIVKHNNEIFGSCVAYEPNTIIPDKYFFAPYYYKTGDSLSYKILGSEDYNYFSLDWYQIPKTLEKPTWTEPYFDKNGGNIIMSTFSVPFYRNENGNRKFNGIVTVDINLTWLQAVIDSMHIIKNGYAFLISKQGTFITHPDDSLIMNENIFSLADKINSPELREIGKRMISGETAYIRLNPFEPENPAWLYFTPLPSNNWSLGILFPEKELVADLQSQFRTMVFLGVVGFILLFIVITLIAKRITWPLKKLASATEEIGDGNFDVTLPEILYNDEIGRLTNSFEAMKTELKSYVRNLELTTAAKNKIESELKIAHDIQQGIIPKIFPPFPNRDDVDIYAILDPAKEVGGDLYDFFFLDDSHLIFTVGDVSGKGVPASLFMAITRTLFRAKATLNLSASDIVSDINKELCKDNDNAMFVTFFLGILDLETGEMEYCNAGHSYPYILRKNGGIQMIAQTHGTPMGLFDFNIYSHGTITLSSEDSLVVYTDGISEAFNENGELLGTERLENLLKQLAGENNPETITNAVLNGTRSFVGNAEQSDDITILVLTSYLKNNVIFNTDEKHLEIINRFEDLKKVEDFVDEFGKEWKIEPGIISKINLTAEEIVTNIIKYGYTDNGDHSIRIVGARDNGKIILRFQDDGIPFNPLMKKEPHLDVPLEEREIGGLGIHFVKQLMDNVEYRFEDGKNILQIEKKCSQLIK